MSILLFAVAQLRLRRVVLFAITMLVQMIYLLLAVIAFRLWGAVAVVPALLLVVNSVNVARLASHHYIHNEIQPLVQKQWFTLMGTAIVAVLLIEVIEAPLHSVLIATGAGAALFALLSLVTTIRTLNQSLVTHKDSDATSLPSVTVAIPARNETHALTQCIEAVLSSHYRKLEIIVLDDCSQDQTPKLIKKFAHAGVRFVQGRPPEDGWLGKNNAYKVLLQEASGQYVIFAGVDVIFSPDSIGKMVAHMEQGHLQMASFAPARGASDIPASVLQPLRYWWQFAAAWFLGQRKPAVSSCVAFDRHSLSENNLLGAFKDTVVPEVPLANYYAAHGGYAFLQGSFFGLSTRKRISSQFETAQRTLYPQLGTNLLLFSTKLFCMIVFASQPIVAIYSAAQSLPVLLSLSSASMIFFFMSFALVQKATSPKSWLLTLPESLFAWPIEILLTVWSFYGYELGEVRWKGRNICIPVMGQSTPD